jgi:hypothetical protein
MAEYGTAAYRLGAGLDVGSRCVPETDGRNVTGDVWNATVGGFASTTALMTRRTRPPIRILMFMVSI